jgi:hypothetical protein
MENKIRKFKVFGKKICQTKDFTLYETKEVLIIDKEAYIIGKGKTIVLRIKKGENNGYSNKR